MSSLAPAGSKFPLHMLVWNNDYGPLEEELEEKDVDECDPRGRTPLHLAVSLGHIESARVLLRHKSDVTKENLQGWTGKSQDWNPTDVEMQEDS
uniref:Uncharacterized protein n=1 Tax=Sphenodon punctatus TaxID=8508 RepID=A0A8D0GXM1_SPHPU